MQLYTLHNAGQVIRQVKSLLCIVCPPRKNFMQDYLSYLRMRSSLARMRSSLVVRASDCQCTSCNGPGFYPSIRRHSGI
jgi:hypothetical protein